MSLFQIEGKENLMRQCMTNKRKAEEIIDSLGLQHRRSGRAKPVFDDPMVQHLYKLVSGAVELYTNTSIGTPSQLIQDLPKDETITKSVEEICSSVGQKIWGIPSKKHLLTPGANVFYPKQLLWDNEKHREEIRVYIRCWIMKRASRKLGDETRKRKDASKPGEQASPGEKGRKSGKVISVTDEDTSDEGEYSSTSKPTTPATATRTPIRSSLPRSPQMSTPNRGGVPAQAGEASTATVIDVEDNDDDSLYADPPGARRNTHLTSGSPSDPNKRKRSDFDVNLRGKFSRPSTDWKRKLPEIPKNRSGNVDSVPASPSSPVFPTAPVPIPFGRRRRVREPTEESDPSWRPARGVSMDRESESSSAVNQRMENAFGKLPDPFARFLRGSVPIFGMPRGGLPRGRPRLLMNIVALVPLFSASRIV
ncbi:hypothetical protein P154DRAFT_520278 [Amniculicola lignicola CBS 123094]|uniref:Uncharacterized protein n=1 Tax=Amniculicola lignicola CBS 123094 TaxID=1392246 RepID=A0A6A5WNN3_9PLEO|nr:hypothetical protein P154DRAFT_520278 [Amniculicola lignicola CBS 123094]